MIITKKESKNKPTRILAGDIMSVYQSVSHYGR
jgi:hypothetical protein